MENFTDEKNETEGNPIIIKKAIMVQIAIGVVMFIVTIYYCYAHGIRWPFVKGVEFSNFDFLGKVKGNPVSFASVMEEAFVWSILGVLTAEEIRILDSIIKKKSFNLWLTVSAIIANIAIGLAVAMGLIALLVASKFSISGISLTLDDIKIESAIAISFLLGLFHSDAKDLLGSFKNSLVKKVN